MNIEHRTTPIEHWIVDGKAYRMATEADIGKDCYFSDAMLSRLKSGIERCLHGKLTRFNAESTDKYWSGGTCWLFALIEDDSLITPKHTPVPELGDGWYLLTAEDGFFKKGDKANASLTDGGGWVNCDCIEGKSLKEWIEGNCRAARYFGEPEVEHVVDCVIVEQRIAQRIMDDKAIKQAEATVTNWAVVPTTKPIDWTKPVRTKDRRAVRVLCTDGPGDYPVVGFIDGVDGPESWLASGSYFETFGDERDLENAPQRIQREYWVNVYADRIGCQCKTQAVAKDMRENGCLACVKITIDCEEGEGL